MTKSTITREQLEEWVTQFDEDGGCDSTDRQLEALIRQSLAAMDSSESVELPLDYLQGHKDGLEWAAQLAKANHPETGDWLYDDPIELAKAIRKGPDMPPAQPVADSEPVIVVGDDGGDALSYRRLIQSFEPGTKLYLHAQPAPAVPGKWIPVSEQKPDCWCLTCRPVVLNDMRFVVCPDCGNKRCPRANDHRNACTGSNEPGQEGGAYPDTPQEVKP
ncbi:TPA: hypothetical protein ACVWT1_001638 [Klebsiella pneumoniae]